MAIYEGSNRDDTKTGDFTLMDGGLANDVLQDTHAGEIIMYGGPGFDFVAIDYIQNPDTFGTLYGGPGNDVVYGGAKKDTLYGGTTGDDYVVAHGHGSQLYGRNGSDALVAGPGARDVLIVGGDGDDNASVTITVRDQNRHPFTVQAGLYGSPGDDRIFGNDGDDLLIGGDGRDILHGGDGHDVMIGGLGPDDQLGGNGNDIFRFLAVEDSFHGSKHRDFISDFDPREHDRIDVSGIDANELLAGDQAFKFIGTHKFHDRAGELRFSNDVLRGDTDGDGRTDFEVKLDVRGGGPDDLSQHDLVL